MSLIHLLLLRSSGFKREAAGNEEKREAGRYEWVWLAVLDVALEGWVRGGLQHSSTERFDRGRNFLRRIDFGAKFGNF